MASALPRFFPEILLHTKERAWHTHGGGSSEGKISLAKGIIFTKIGLANGYILKLWAAPP